MRASIEIPEPVFRVQTEYSWETETWRGEVTVGDVSVFRMKMRTNGYGGEEELPFVYDEEEAIDTVLRAFGLKLKEVLGADTHE